MNLQIVQPNAVTDATLTSSNVPETVPAAYAGGTTYALAATASVAGTLGAYTVYESLQNSNTGHTPASSPTWWRALGTVYQAYSGAATYAALERVQDNTAHKIYESLVAGNVGNALTDTAKWVEVGSTNRWLMFDQTIGTRTSRAEAIVVQIAPGKVTNSVCLIDINAASARVKMTDPSAGTVYDKTTSLVSDSVITNWYDYFFAPFEYKTQLNLFDLPASGTPTLEITLTNSGGTAECGACVLGVARDIAPVRAGATVGMTDYSKKTQDEWGNFSIVERAFAKRASFKLLVPKNKVDFLQRLMAAIRGTPTVFVASNTYEATTIYGFVKDYDINIAYPDHSEYSLDLEGLT
jgi:hypothetical protein